MYEIQRIPLSRLALNTGQIEGLPANPRQWTRDDVNRIAASLKETPELFEMRPIIAVEHGKECIILAGSLRYCGAKENGDKDAPVIVLTADTPAAKLKEIVLKDNGSFGSWDMDALADEWDDLPLADWGVPVWKADLPEEEMPTDLDADPKEKPFVLKITFPSADKMTAFVMAYKDTLENDYGCMMSESGGEL